MNLRILALLAVHPLFRPTRLYAGLLALLLLICVVLLAGCSQLAAYDRTYSVSYTGADGQQLGTSVTLRPAKTGGLAK